MSTTKEVRQMIIQCWYRNLVSLSPIDDIVKIMNAFSEQYEKFEVHHRMRSCMMME